VIETCYHTCIYIYMIDSDRRPVSNRRPLLKSASTDIIISNHGPILGYSNVLENITINNPLGPHYISCDTLVVWVLGLFT
jgi:hypothetical protein